MKPPSRLREALRSRNSELHSLVLHLVGQATPILWHSIATFPSGTSHTPEHTDTVEFIAGLLLQDSVLATLTDDELLFVILACHYHDLGMVGSEADNSTAEGRDRVRREHAISIGEKIIHNWRQLGFPDETVAQVLAGICRGHRPTRDSTGIADWSDLPHHRILGPGRSVRQRLVSAIIYAADELHLGSDRASKRQEEWKEVRDHEARRHWRRHQAISGPDLISGEICFDLTVNTSSLEADLRQTVQKALFAVRDLRRELTAADLPPLIPPIKLQWLRDRLWQLLIIEAASDEVPRGVDTLAQSALNRFDTFVKDFADLSLLCVETPNDSTSLRKHITDGIRDLIVQEHLRPNLDNSSYAISMTRRSCKHFLNVARDADATEALFGRSNPPQHEQHLYRSPLGKAFIRDVGFAEVKTQYAVDLATEPLSSPVRQTFESSPTAFRITQAINTPPGVLVKRDLLSVAVAAGVCFDLMDNPALILNAEFREAVRGLFTFTAERLPKYQRFIEELALVGGLSYDQISAIALMSDEMRDEIVAPETPNGPTVKISQTSSKDRTDWGIPYLLLASQRTEETVTILNLADTPLSVKVDSPDERFAWLANQMPAMISFGPGEPQLSKDICLRARVEFDSSERLLRFVARPLSGNTTGYPFIIHAPSKPPNGSPAPISMSMYFPEVTVGSLQTVLSAIHMSRSSAVQMQLFVEDLGVLGSNELTSDHTLQFPELIPDQILSVLVGCDPHLPLPCIAPRGSIDGLVETAPKDRPVRFAEIVQNLNGHKPHLTSIRLRVANAMGRDFHEEFLGFLPEGIHFSPPTIDGTGGVTQEEINEKWLAGDQHFRIGSHFREDYARLASELRRWMDDPKHAYPFHGVDAPAQDFHYCKTTIENEHLPHVDRMWYIERPVIIRFRPATRSEQYRIEKQYWDAINDHDRSQLVQERILQAEQHEQVLREASQREGNEKCAEEWRRYVIPASI